MYHTKRRVCECMNRKYLKTSFIKFKFIACVYDSKSHVFCDIYIWAVDQCAWGLYRVVELNGLLLYGC